MEHTRTQTNTPPAEAVGLHGDRRRGSSGNAAVVTAAVGVGVAGRSGPGSGSESGPASSSSSSSSTSVSPPAGGNGGSGTTRTMASTTTESHRTANGDYVGDVRASSDHGTITPSQHVGSEPSSQPQQEQHNEELPQDPHQVYFQPPALFKPFDGKTGRFLGSPNRIDPAVATADSLAPQTVSADLDDEMRSGISDRPDLAALASLKASAGKSNKFRSLSVPSILHSSLRTMGLSTTGGLFTLQQQQHQQQRQEQQQQQLLLLQQQQQLEDRQKLGNEHINVHPQLPAQQSALHLNRGIKKKRQSKHSASLRHALLMHQGMQSSNHKVSLTDRIKYMKSYPGPMPLPPINLQCLKEIDLQEIVKNPQLRHDIIFDPLLQFRPNLDGERGFKKKQVSEKYWYDVENEIFVYKWKPETFKMNQTRLVPLFNSLKEVLTTIVPQKEVHTVENVLDTELLVQELLKGSLMMSSFADWLAQLFKHHCAPMRDPWVDKMSSKFKESEDEKSVPKLVEGLRLVFQILEAMKLDIANHQIRILRPALLSNAVEFEKQYFQSLMTTNRVDLKSSFKWFQDKCVEYQQSALESNQRYQAPEVYRFCIRSIISLLSCRKMVRDYPTSLSFDHARLVLLRADIRQIVCLLVCRLLFKQLVTNDTTMDKPMKEHILNSYTNRKLKDEIVSIITDEHGNCRWTKNTMAIAIHFCKTISDLRQDYLLQRTMQDVTLARSTSESHPIVQAPSLNNAQIDFSKSWLSKQTQPLSEVYGVLETRVLQQLENSIFSRSGCTQDGTIKQNFVHLCSTMTANNGSTKSAAASSRTRPNTSSSTTFKEVFALQQQQQQQQEQEQQQQHKQQPVSAQGSSGGLATVDMEEFESLFCHLYTLVNFHWSVFGCLYMDYLGDKMEAVH
ncbi:Sok1p LALA0_S10e05930g [Lachancea lanzarotensis]|uniref:LALA0S10e05930g1_1 n=1 Tax=Lachancea lanzarotensis TaxID=1245769 RepID=A0A0C7N8L1_9SACH|nr:uncharacterized protein LALA0_S10e05930g [Lachancea lanzarotensis]CEP64251.1 LALA0S10e05930g1_1 [Lachancea lanzarotensis]